MITIFTQNMHYLSVKNIIWRFSEPLNLFKIHSQKSSHYSFHWDFIHGSIPMENNELNILEYI